MVETATTSRAARPLRPHSPDPAPRAGYDVDGPLPSTPRRRRTVAGDPVPPPARRDSISLQDAKSVLHSTTQSVLAPTDTENPTWHTIPLAFAVLPAIGGVLFKGGTYFVTDVMLLFLVAVFLHWLVKFPWEWYHISQAIAADDAASALGPPTPPSSPRASAARELRFNEHLALLSCFVGPLLGGWLLHAIRSQLSRPSEGLVSNFNLTIFVLAAELRPVAQVVKLVRARSLHLQSIAHRPPPTKLDALAARVDALQDAVRELRGLTAKAAERDPDLDALNRAVRRYEKKEAMHSALTETRMMEIDGRLNDVLTLAAAAAAARREGAGVMVLGEWACALLVVPFTVAWRLVSLPARVVETVAGLRGGRLLIKGVEGRKGRGKGAKGRRGTWGGN